MNEFTPPIFPKFEISQLIKLENYYEELVNYHEDLASVARLNLNSIKNAIALSREETTLPRIQEKQLIYQISPTSQSDICIDKHLNGHDRQKTLSIDFGVTEEEIKQILSLEFQSSQGSILSLDCLIQKLYGSSQCENNELSQVIRNQVKKLLHQGEEQQQWYAVPDSPDCWTSDLKKIDTSRKIPKRESTKHEISELKRKAIRSFLKKIYPKSASIKEIVNAIYSKSFSPKNDHQFYHNIQQTIYAYQNKLWKRTGKGLFIWIEK
jgi:hypothetical protein